MTTPYDPLPDPPQRNDPATFADKGDAFLGALPDFGAWMDEVRIQGNTVLEAAPMAIAAANYQGEYNAGTTYQIGMSVSYLGNRFYAKTVNIGVTPTNGANWGQIWEVPNPTGQEGKGLRVIAGAPAWGSVDVSSDTLTMTGNQTLAAASDRALRLISATGSFSVTLPDATTISAAGGVVFYFVNDSGLAHDIRDNAARLLLTLGHGESVILWCSDTTTAAGVWVSSENERVLSAGTEALAHNAAATANLDVCDLSTDKALIVYQTTGSVIQARVVSLSGTVVTLGTAVTALSSVNATARCCKIGTDKAIIAGHKTGSLATAVVVTVSGTTITVGTAVTFDTTVGQDIDVCPLNTDKAIFIEGRTNQIRTTVLSVSGTTITPGTVQTHAVGLATGTGCAVQLGTDRVIYSYVNGSAANGLTVFTVSGTTVTSAGTGNGSTAAVLGAARIIPISSSAVMMVGFCQLSLGVTSYFVGGCVVTIPVNTPLFGQVRELSPMRFIGSNALSLDVCMFGSTTGLVTYGDLQPVVPEVRARTFRIVGGVDVVADSDEVRLAEYGNASRSIALAKVSADKAVSLFREADTFAYVQGIALRGSL